MDLSVSGMGSAQVDARGTAIMSPLPHYTYDIVVSCPRDCYGRIMKQHDVRTRLKTVAGMVIDEHSHFFKVLLLLSLPFVTIHAGYN